MPTLEGVTHKYSLEFPISRRDTLYLLGGGLVLAACGSRQYEGRVQGDLVQKIDSNPNDPKQGQYTLAIKLSNLPQGAKDLNLKAGDKITVVLPKSKIADPYSRRLRQCPDVRTAGSSECYLDLKIVGLKGQGPNQQYDGIDVYNVEVKTSTGAKEKGTEFLERAKEKATELWERAKEKTEEYGVRERGRQLWEDLKKAIESSKQGKKE